MSDYREVAEIQRLRQEVELYKSRMEILKQTRVALEEKIIQVSQEFEEYKALVSTFDNQSQTTHWEDFTLVSADSDFSLSINDSTRKLVNEDSSEKSAEICTFFLKGKCRRKHLCRFSHKVSECPYCGIILPGAKIAASTHLGRCYKLLSKSNVSTNAQQCLMCK